MSMSTNIDDLPGPSPDENNYEYEENLEDDYDYEQYTDDVTSNTQPLPVSQKNDSKDLYYDQPSKIKMDIRKRKNKQDNSNDTFELIKNEINEENLLLLAILYLSSMNITEEYTKKFLSLLSINNSSSLIVTIVKSVLLLIIFILAKYFLLPYLSI